MLSLIAIPLLLSGLLQIPYVQTKVVNYISGQVAEELQVDVRVGHVALRFLNTLTLEEVFVSDQQGDTLFFIGELDAGIGMIRRDEKSIHLTKVKMTEFFMHLNKEADGYSNLRFLVQYLKKDSASATQDKWKIFADEVATEDSRVYITRFDAEPKRFGVNYFDLRFTDLNIYAHDFSLVSDSIQATFNQLSFREASGLTMKQITGELLVHPQVLSLENTRLQLAESNLELKSLRFDYADYDGLSDFVEQVQMEINLQNAQIFLSELALFAPSLEGMKDELSIDAYVTGKVGSLNCQYVDLAYGDETRFKGDIQFMGLPEVEETFIHADIETFRTYSADVESLRLPDLAGESYVQIPALVKDLGVFTYRGYFTGFVADFVAFGELKSDAGTLLSDIKLSENPLTQTLQYTGRIATEHYQLSKVFPTLSSLGHVNLDLKLSGYRTGNRFSTTTMEGTVQEISFNNQIIRGFELRGKQENKRFDGFVQVDDEHLSLEFSGIIDFSDEVPFFSFSALVDTFNLAALGLTPSDSIATFSADIQTNFRASTLDDLEGEILLWDVAYNRNGNPVQMDNFALFANRIAGNSYLSLQSSLLDLQIDGQYLFKDIPRLMTQYLSYYFPSSGIAYEPVEEEHDFTYSLEVKSSDSLLRAFLPSLRLPEGGTFFGSMNSSTPTFELMFDVPIFRFNTTEVKHANASIIADFEELRFDWNAEKITVSESFFLDSLTFVSTSKSDTSLFSLQWKNRTTQNNQGNINALLYIEDRSPASPRFFLDLLSSELVVADSVWSIEPGSAQFGSDGLLLDSFNALHNDQSISLRGGLNRQETDTFLVQLSNIELADFSPLTRNWTLDPAGLINGTASILTGPEGSLFFADLQVDSFILNEHHHGDLFLSSVWNDSLKLVEVDSRIQSGKLTPMRVNGTVQPNGGMLDLSITLDKMNLKAAEPWLTGIFSDMNGLISNRLKLTGPASQPQLLGELKVQKAAFTVDYLQTRYFFSDIIQFTPDTIRFSQVAMTDQDGNPAQLNGHFSHRSFRNIAMDLSILSDKILVLNTDFDDNASYYGRALAAGIFRLSGPLNKLLIDINAKTLAGTSFLIPLDSGSEASSGSFVTFVNPNEQNLEKEAPEEVTVPGGLRLNFNLEVTPEAEVQMIFDSKMGDIIKGNGTANLKMEINSQGDFTMYGDYTIQKGEYLLTLANFFSRKFKIKEGGTIRWTGSPYEADMDIVAYYEAQAQLKDLLSDSSDVYRNKLQVECQIAMNGKLLEPDFNFGIQLPPSADTEQAIIDGLPENELNKQFISLLVINQFQPLSGFSLAGGSAFGSSNLSQNTTEILSNQLSHWISQISNDFDIGFKYRPGNELSTDELEFALRTQLFNDYLTINGNLGVGGQYAFTNTMVGDVEAELKITPSGKVRIKAFNRSNTNLDYEKGPFTRGVGVFFREEFNSVGDLWKKYFRFLSSDNTDQVSESN